ncbi:MAG: 2-succinyl-5-enolpyruvyl-6-hydroxy-3-cyclohexene-1-carboxylic-acid synthase, partial [Bacteroidaceae bacterium]|nr:2-succinyl-5-enolpyruvyl-6-hydroxy-3-cyclohexene-1-carboxylic-acid synthase [Bacteroidaceae bacterium]
DCNRGVSGIDGSSSTALGASLASDAPTLLITGDMSFSYDLNAITTQYNHKNFKLIVMENGGGGIFRFIPSTDSLPELEQYFEIKRKFPIKRTAEAFGFTCFEAANITELKERLAKLYACDTPAMLIVHTDAETDTKLLKRYMSRNYKKG